MKKRPRPKSETLRIYGPPERREFVKSQPCVACGKQGDSENAHIETGGMGRKADFDKIIPLCGTRLEFGEKSCHALLHALGRDSFVDYVWVETGIKLDLDQCAADTQNRWLQYKEGRPE